jgi:hypothetical protein
MTTQDREPVDDVVWPLARAAAPAATPADRVGDLSGKTVGGARVRAARQQEG